MRFPITCILAFRWLEEIAMSRTFQLIAGHPVLDL